MGEYLKSNPLPRSKEPGGYKLMYARRRKAARVETELQRLERLEKKYMEKIDALGYCADNLQKQIENLNQQMLVSSYQHWITWQSALRSHHKRKPLWRAEAKDPPRLPDQPALLQI